MLESRLMWLSGALGVAVLLVGFGYVLGARGQFARGRAAGDAAVARLTVDYAAKSAQAAAAARAAQAQADASALAEAERRAAAGNAQAAQAQTVASAAQAQLARQRTAITTGVQHDATLEAWMAVRLPAGVRGVLDGAAH